MGYTDINGDIQDGTGLKQRALDAVNQIGYDLCRMAPVNNLLDEITVDDDVKHAMPYGVAMLLSFSDGDGSKNQLMCELYNAKRTLTKSKKEHIGDVIPTGEV